MNFEELDVIYARNPEPDYQLAWIWIRNTVEYRESSYPYKENVTISFFWGPFGPPSNFVFQFN